MKQKKKIQKSNLTNDLSTTDRNKEREREREREREERERERRERESQKERKTGVRESQKERKTGEREREENIFTNDLFSKKWLGKVLVWFWFGLVCDVIVDNLNPVL